MNKVLTPTEVEAKLKAYPHWNLVRGAIERELHFKDFKEAFAFMTRVAELAESQNHHPDWENVYNRVLIRLNTHDANGITEKDFRLAQAIDQLA